MPPAPIGAASRPSAPPLAGGGPLSLAAGGRIAAFAAQKARATALRTCLRDVGRQASDERRGARRRSVRKRASALRQITRRAAKRRRSCIKRYGRTPGRVTGLDAEATARTIKLTFRAVGSDRSKPPASRTYLVKQSRHRIRTQRDFRRARALCNRVCRFKVTEVGARVTLTISGLRRHSTYYYAIAARDNVSARTGRRSTTIRVRTR